MDEEDGEEDERMLMTNDSNDTQSGRETHSEPTLSMTVGESG